MLKAIYFSAIALLFLSSGSVSATTSSETVLGEVISVMERTREVIRQTPLTERVCQDKDVPVYGSNGQQKNDLGSMIIGGIIGSAIGNKMSDSEGAGAAGTVAGAIIGKTTADEANKIQVDLASKSGEHIGPVISKTQYDKIQSFHTDQHNTEDCSPNPCLKGY